MTDYFPPAAAATYDEKNRKLSPISEAIHFLTGLVLKDLPPRARILCIGVGTGAEILSLATKFPEWTFVGVDPSEAMLKVCKDRLEAAHVLDRCQLIHGYTKDVAEEKFDAAVSILVGHFVPRDERSSLYQQIINRLNIGGCFVNIEISFDLNSDSFPAMLKEWSKIQSLMGATPSSLDNLESTLRERLAILPPNEVEDLMKQAGFGYPIKFFQTFMISGWYAKKL